MAILGKLDDFQGAARFTTWACKFVILELSTRLRRRAWRGRVIDDETVWNRLADASPSVIDTLQGRELRAALRHAVAEDLTDRQRLVFRSAVVQEVPIDVLAERLSCSRGAIYKVLHDARRSLRRALARAGHLEGSRT
jgi:RNA polymerase sigma-70 factor (ECF subfamily)